MNIELKPIAESKVRQLGGDVCGVLVRKDEKLAAVDEHGRVQWLQGDSEHTAYLEGMNAHLKAELKAARAQGVQGAEAVAWEASALGGKRLFHDKAEAETSAEVYGGGARPLVYGDTQPQRAVPEGWKLVPVEATGDMEEAGCQGYMEADGNWHMHRSSMGFAYKAMLEAAPAPTTPQADGWVRCAPPSEADGDYCGQAWAIDRNGEIELLSVDDIQAEWRSHDEAEIIGWMPTDLKPPHPPAGQGSDQ